MGLPFLLMPVLTKHLSPDDYALLRLLNVFVVILIPFVGLSSQSILAVEFHKRTRASFSLIFSNTLLLALCTLPLIGAFSYFINYLNYWSSWQSILIFFLVFFTVFTELLTVLLVQKKDVKTYTIAILSKTIIEAILTLYFIVYLEYDWMGRVYAWFFVQFLFSIFAVFYFKKENWFNFKVNKAEVFLALSFGVPLIPHVLGKFAINQSDLIFLSEMVSLKETGLYSVGYQFGSLVSILAGILLNIYSPFLFKNLNNSNEEQKLRVVQVSYLFVTVIVVAFLMLLIVLPFIFQLLSSEYNNSIQYVGIIGLSYCFHSIYLVFAGQFFFFKNTLFLTLVSIISVLTNLVLNYVLIHTWGSIGAAYATLISFAIVMVITVYASMKRYPLPWLNKKIFKKWHL